MTRRDRLYIHRLVFTPDIQSHSLPVSLHVDHDFLHAARQQGHRPAVLPPQYPPCGMARYKVVDTSWHVPQLKKECKRRGFTNYSRLNKAQLIEKLNQEGAGSIDSPRTTPLLERDYIV